MSSSRFKELIYNPMRNTKKEHIFPFLDQSSLQYCTWSVKDGPASIIQTLWLGGIATSKKVSFPACSKGVVCCKWVYESYSFDHEPRLKTISDLESIFLMKGQVQNISQEHIFSLIWSVCHQQIPYIRLSTRHVLSAKSILKPRIKSTRINISQNHSKSLYLLVKFTQMHFSRLFYSREHSGKWMHAEKTLYTVSLIECLWIEVTLKQNF